MRAITEIRIVSSILLLQLAACGGHGTTDAGTRDVGTDAPLDAGTDSGPVDAGPPPPPRIHAAVLGMNIDPTDLCVIPFAGGAQVRFSDALGYSTLARGNITVARDFTAGDYIFDFVKPTVAAGTCGDVPGDVLIGSSIVTVADGDEFVVAFTGGQGSSEAFHAAVTYPRRHTPPASGHAAVRFLMLVVDTATMPLSVAFDSATGGAPQVVAPMAIAGGWGNNPMADPMGYLELTPRSGATVGLWYPDLSREYAHHDGVAFEDGHLYTVYALGRAFTSAPDLVIQICDETMPGAGPFETCS